MIKLEQAKKVSLVKSKSKGKEKVMVASFRECTHKPLLRLNSVVYKEGKEWVACCLELDLIATGATRKVVEKDIVDLITVQIKYAFENGNFKNILRYAPAEEWQRLRRAKKCKSSIIPIKIDRRKIPLKKQPIREVELCLV